MAVDYSEDTEYANAKLSDSVVMLGKTVVYIAHVFENGNITYHTLDGTDRREGKLADLDLTPIKLGYLNFRMGCSYLWRTPARHYRQGLRSATLRSSNDLRGWSFGRGKELNHTALGIYPDITDCYEQIICGEASARAFCREFALTSGNKNGMNLHFKGRKVGTCGWGDRGPDINLMEEFRYLNELLMESLDAQKDL